MTSALVCNSSVQLKLWRLYIFLFFTFIILFFIIYSEGRCKYGGRSFIPVPGKESRPLRAPWLFPTTSPPGVSGFCYFYFYFLYLFISFYTFSSRFLWFTENKETNAERPGRHNRRNIFDAQIRDARGSRNKKIKRESDESQTATSKREATILLYGVVEYRI